MFPPIRTREIIRLGIGLLIGAAALWWAQRGLDLPALRAALADASPTWILVSLACVVAVALTKAARWGALYGPNRGQISFGDLFSVLVAAQMLNLIIPIRVGELVRVGMMKQLGRPGSATLLTILVEKTLDLLTAGLAATSLVLLAVAPAWLRQPANGLLLIGLTLGLGLGLVWRLRDKMERSLRWAADRCLPGHWRKHLLGMVQTMLTVLGGLSGWRALVPVLFWTTLSWLLSLLTMVTLFFAFGLVLPVTAAVLLMLAISTSNIAPSPPALVGVIHGIAVAVLGQYGVPQATALGFGIFLNLVTVGPLIGLGGWAWWRRAMPLRSWLHKRLFDQAGIK